MFSIIVDKHILYQLGNKASKSSPQVVSQVSDDFSQMLVNL